MSLPPMLQAVQQRHMQQGYSNMAAANMRHEQEEPSLTDMLSNTVYDCVDECGRQFGKVAPYLNTALNYGWVPLVMYYGLKQGTHKYFPSNPDISPEMQDVQLERKAAWTDAIPFFGSHGSSQGGMFPQ